jgi:hypothetical protein
MANSNAKPTRKHGRHLRVPVLPEEEHLIKSNAAQSGLTIAEYLRRVGMGTELKSLSDKDAILELSKINADLGRLGGLLKLWLTDNTKVANFSDEMIRTLLRRLFGMQKIMLDKVNKL